VVPVFFEDEVSLLFKPKSSEKLSRTLLFGLKSGEIGTFLQALKKKVPHYPFQTIGYILIDVLN
jgi:hypothetical protein